MSIEDVAAKHRVGSALYCLAVAVGACLIWHVAGEDGRDALLFGVSCLVLVMQSQILLLMGRGK